MQGAITTRSPAGKRREWLPGVGESSCREGLPKRSNLCSPPRKGLGGTLPQPYSLPWVVPPVGQTQLEVRDLETSGDVIHLGQPHGTEQVTEEWRIELHKQMATIRALALGDSAALHVLREEGGAASVPMAPGVTTAA